MEPLNSHIVEIGGREVPVLFAEGVLNDKITAEKVINFIPFRNYCRNMDSRLVARGVTIKSAYLFGERVGFLFIESDIVDAAGIKVPGVVFLRGGSVVVLPILTDEFNEKWVISVKQARAPIGIYESHELPAGMLDGSGDFLGAGAHEIKEELGIDIRSEDLVDMTAEMYGKSSLGVYASPGGTDEFTHILLFRKKVSRKDIEGYTNRKTGIAEDGESITTEVIPLRDVSRLSPLTVTLAALFLYKELGFD